MVAVSPVTWYAVRSEAREAKSISVSYVGRLRSSIGTEACLCTVGFFREDTSRLSVI